MRGTIASETILIGFQPTVVRGYGFVVGLKGTGSRIAPAEIRAWMLREMTKRGIGNPVTSPGSPSPEELLNSEDCAIVIVEGVIPAGAPRGAPFDLRVFAAPGTASSSLEGGRLYTTELRPGMLTPASREAKALGEGKGPIIINPFADPTGTSIDTVNRMSGRVLGGGLVRDDMTIRLRLATPSHVRAHLLANAINSAFPRELGQSEPTAVGRTSEAVDVTVPPSWRTRTDRFVELLRHTPLDPSTPEATALAINRSVTNNPGASGAASWRWQAIGKKSLPMVQQLYSFPEEQPRMAALNAGARLDDPRAVDPLIEIAQTGSGRIRSDAVTLLGDMGHNPKIDAALHPLLDDGDMDVRLAAYEALRKRAHPVIQVTDVDGKFELDFIDSGSPLIYVTQSGHPRIAVFGKGLEITRPMTLRTWGGRLLFKGEEGKPLEVLYRTSASATAVMDEIDPSVWKVARFLGHTPSPERPSPGLGLTYSETISALHEIWRANYLRADFKAEQDRLLADINRVEPESKVPRPDFDPEPGTELTETAPDQSPELAHPTLDASKPSGDTVPR